MSSRLSSASASRSLSGLLDTAGPASPSSPTPAGPGPAFQIHVSSPSGRKSGPPRLTMQSFFDKENKPLVADKGPKNGASGNGSGSRREASVPLRNSTQNSINRRSLSASIKSASNRSFGGGTASKRDSKASLSTAASATTSATATSQRSHKAPSLSSTHSHKSRSSHPRHSVDTFSSISSSINENEPSIITDSLDQLNLSSGELPKQSKRASLKTAPKASSRSSERYPTTTIMENPLPVQLTGENKHEKKKSISKSTSFRSLRNSLSMKSLTSSLKNDDTNTSYTSEYTSSNAEKRSSLKTKRKMSLENIRSFLTNRRSSVDIHSEYRNNISLPIMQPQTKEKIRHKLRNSTSIMSMSSFVSNNDSVGATTEKPKPSSKMKTVDLNQLHHSLLLKLCSQSRCVSFTSYLNKYQTLTPRRHLTKLTKTGKSFLLMEFSCQNSESEADLKPSGVWKVIPIDQNGTLITQVIQELTLTMLMSNKPGFVSINSAKVVSGPCPNSLLDLMDVSSYNDKQLYLIMRLDYAGISLKDFQLESWKEASTILNQVLDALCLGENENYEHRDLNIENIMIKRTTREVQDLNNPNNLVERSFLDVTIIDHALARGIVSGQLMYRNLYDADFFKGSGEYRHTIYKLMRRVVANSKANSATISSSSSSMSISTLKTEMSTNDSSSISNSGSHTDWSQSYSIFNLLWVHYLLHILLFEKGLKPLKMNPILKKKGRLVNGGEVGEENAIYERLMQGYRMVEPAVLFGNRKNRYMREIRTIHEFRDWYQNLNA